MGEKGNDVATTTQAAGTSLLGQAESTAGDVIEASTAAVTGAATGLATERVHDQLDKRIDVGRLEEEEKQQGETPEGGAAPPKA